MNDTVVVILAAGKGTRMCSNLHAKVCHKVGHKTMLEHVIDTSFSLNPKDIIVVVSEENIKEISKLLINYNSIKLKFQYEQLGTGNAVLSAFPCCDMNDLLVLLGDVPLISSKTLTNACSSDYDAVIVGFRDSLENRFGRIIVEDNKVIKIVEYLDATPEERLVTLCNSGMLWIKSKYVPLLYQIDNNNKKNEYYLTDIVKIMVNKHLKVGVLETSKDECMGVNTLEELKSVNDLYQNIKQN